MSQGYYSESYPSSDSGSDNISDAASAELKLYRAFIFSAPIFFTFILLFLFYVFYLRPRRVDWSSLRMRPFSFPPPHSNSNTISTWDIGLKKEFREMLPIIVYKESFSVKDTLCSVCLLDYQAEDRLQQIPACGHTFHMSCIDLWLASHSTCPLCRLSLLASAKSSTEPSNLQVDGPQSNEETQTIESSELQSTSHVETTVSQNVSGEVSIVSHCIDVEGQNEQNNQ
ncbi:RING-H2 finger protein atl7 [Stylosanthes scabra]|uniref:RING-type E3 ubiquitin transferase n=1 Tax=Stylosanthes scabra TaxID=79078 RepID=A0ABU6RFE3_9FABA|nr:RING-H2 finger protein atl7 [Stylosanthes scabra]